MAAAYSMDLRTRVLKDSDAGLSSKELAARYHVSRAWVDALKQGRRETGPRWTAENGQFVDRSNRQFLWRPRPVSSTSGPPRNASQSGLWCASSAARICA